MKLKKIKLYNWDLEKFIAQIDSAKNYLVHIKNRDRDTWHAGKFSFVDNGGRGWWSFNLGSHITQLNCRAPWDKLDKEFHEVYEIVEEEKMLKIALRRLSGEKI